MAESQISTLTKQKQYHKRRQQQKKMKKKFYGLTKTEIIDRHKLLVKSLEDGGYGLAVGHTATGAANQGDMMKVLVEKKGMGYSDTILGNDQIELLSDDKFMMVEMIIDLQPGTVLTKGIKCFRLSTDDDQKTGSDGLRLEVNPRVNVGNKVMMKKLIAGEVGLKATADDLIRFAETGYIAQDVLDGVQWMGFSREEKLFHIVARYPMLLPGPNKKRFGNLIQILFRDDRCEFSGVKSSFGSSDCNVASACKSGDCKTKTMGQQCYWLNGKCGTGESRPDLNKGGSSAKYKRRKKMSHRKKTKKRKVRKKGTKKKGRKRRRTRRKKRRKRKRRTKRRKN
jgi:hypothetical protein